MTLWYQVPLFRLVKQLGMMHIVIQCQMVEFVWICASFIKSIIYSQNPFHHIDFLVICGKIHRIAAASHFSYPRLQDMWNTNASPTNFAIGQRQQDNCSWLRDFLNHATVWPPRCSCSPHFQNHTPKAPNICHSAITCQSSVGRSTGRFVWFVSLEISIEQLPYRHLKHAFRSYDPAKSMDDVR